MTDRTHVAHIPRIAGEPSKKSRLLHRTVRCKTHDIIIRTSVELGFAEHGGQYGGDQLLFLRHSICGMAGSVFCFDAVGQIEF